MKDYFDRFAITLLDNRGAYDRLAERAKAGAVRSVGPTAAVATQAASSAAELAAYQALQNFWWANGESSTVIACIDKSVAMAKYGKYAKGAGAVLTVGYLGYDFYINIRQWRNGEIDGAKCVKRISTSITGVAAGFGGACFGAAVAGPVGAVVGGVVAGLIGQELCGSTFNLIVGNDRERAVARAFEDLGLTPKATNEEVRQAYLHLARQHHPDKNNGQNTAVFIKINMAYELIRAHRISGAGDA